MPEYKPEVTEVEIRVVSDDDGDASYLDQPEFEERREEFRRGDFSFVGVYAVAKIRFATPQGGWTGLNEIRTPGLWSIESDSDEDYFRDVADEELGELRSELRALGISDELPDAASVTLTYR